MGERFRRGWLIAAVVVGCLLSAVQILHDVRVPLPWIGGVAARVNGRQIDADSVNRTVAGMDARDRRSDAVARHAVLSRMIDEELLVQHALDSGAAQTSPEVRAALVRAAITRVNSEAAATPVGQQELEQYYAAHREAYASVPRFAVTPMYFESKTFPDTSDAQHRAEAAMAAIRAGRSVEQVRLGADPLQLVPPGDLISVRTLANYFGPAVAESVERAVPGELTSISPMGRGVMFVRLDRKIEGNSPPLADVRELVLADTLRERQERALESLLVSLHKAARIETLDLQDVAAAR